MSLDLLKPFIPIGSALISGLFGSSGQRSANEANVALGREQMKFQEEMSGTAYRRAVADMRAAGLNPMLAYSQGGASAPVGSMPQVQNVAGAGVSSAVQGLSLVGTLQQVLQSEAQIGQIEAQTKRIEAETLEKEVYSGKGAAELKSLEAEAKYADLLREEDVRKRRAEARVKTTEAELVKDTFSADVARRRAESELTRLAVPQAKAGAELFSSELGEKVPWLKPLLQILQVIRGVSSARDGLR